MFSVSIIFISRFFRQSRFFCLSRFRFFCLSRFRFFCLSQFRFFCLSRFRCSDPSYESDPSNEYSLLGLTHVMNSVFLDPSDEFLTQVVNIGTPKQILGFCFHVSKRGYKIGYELTREEIYWRLPMLWPVTEAWPGLAGV